MKHAEVCSLRFVNVNAGKFKNWSLGDDAAASLRLGLWIANAARKHSTSLSYFARASEPASGTRVCMNGRPHEFLTAGGTTR